MTQLPSKVSYLTGTHSCHVVYDYQVTLVYNWVIVPLRLVFPLLHRSGWYFTVFDAIADLVLYLDIYGNFSLSFTVNAEVIRDPVRIARRYMSQNFVFDLICTFPYTAMMPSHQVITRVPRLCRCVRSRDNHEHNTLIHFIMLVNVEFGDLLGT